MKTLLMLGMALCMQKTDVPEEPQIVYGIYQDETCETPAADEKGKPETFVMPEDGLVTGAETDMYCRQIQALPGFYADPAVIFVPAGEEVHIIPESVPITYRLKIMEENEECEGKITVFLTDGTPAEEPFVPEAGKEYVLREEEPPPGYLCEDVKIAFPLYPQEEPEFVLERKQCGSLKISSDVPGTVSFYRDAECEDEICGILPDAYHVNVSEQEEEIRLLPGNYMCRICCADETYFEAEALPAVIEAGRDTEVDFVHRPVDVKFVFRGIEKTEDVKLVFQCGEEEMTVIPSAGETIVRMKRNRMYLLHASEVPAGVFPFADQQIVCPEHAPSELPVYELEFVPFTVEVSAVDAESGRRLNDAVFRIAEAEWHMKDSASPLKDGRKLLFHAGQTFEVQAEPSEVMYVIPEKRTFRIPETGSAENNVIRFEIPCISYSRIEIDSGTDSPFVCGVYTDRECTKAAHAMDGSCLEEICGTGTLSSDIRNGVYWIREKKAPAGYDLNDEIIRVEVSHERKTAVLPHHKLICRIRVEHKEKPVSGIKMKITDENGRLAAEFTSASGSAGTAVEGLEYGRRYYLSMKEDKRTAPVREQIVIRPSEKEQEFLYEVIPCYQLDLLCEGTSGEEIGDAAMTVYADEKCTEKVKDGENIHEIFLPEGTYYVRPSKIPEMFYQDESVYKTEMKEDTSLKIRLEPVVCRVRAETAGSSATEARFRITDSDGKIIAEWDSDQGEYPLSEGKPVILERNRDYAVTQADIRGQYICRQREKILHTELHAPAEVPVICFENDHYATVFLREKNNDGNMEGIRCTLYEDEGLSREAADPYGNRMSADTDENGTVYWHILSGVYWLKEEFLNDVYYPGRPLRIDVDASVNDQVIIHREQVPASFAVHAADENGDTLAGAGFSIYDADDNEVFSFVSGSSEQIISGDRIIPAGRYRIHQTSAPAGYACAETDIIIELPAEAPDHVPAAEIVVPDAVMPPAQPVHQKRAVRAEAKETGKPYMIPAVIAACLFSMAVLSAVVRRRKKEISNDTEKINDFD